jgi:hypothetical protein
MFLLLFAFLSTSAASSQKLTLTILQHHTRHAAFQELLDYVATSTWCYDGLRTYACEQPLHYEELKCTLSESECFARYHSKIDVIYSPSTNWKTEKFTPINLDLFNNLLSYRVPVVHKKFLPTFTKRFDQKALKTIPLVFNQNWQDFQLLRQQGYSVVPVQSYDEMVLKLMGAADHYTLRGVTELAQEPDFFASKELVPVTHKLVYYPLKTQLYIDLIGRHGKKTFYHRLLHIEHRNPKFLQNYFARHAALRENRPCQLYDGARNVIHQLPSCTLDALTKRTTP